MLRGICSAAQILVDLNLVLHLLLHPGPNTGLGVSIRPLDPGLMRCPGPGHPTYLPGPVPPP